MTEAPDATQPVVVVTGANGLVGERVCAELAARGAAIRAVVRSQGKAPELPGVTEEVGDFADAEHAARLVDGATAVVTTVHPMGHGEKTQRDVAVEGTPVIARAARDAGVRWLVHVSTAAVYDRVSGAGDVTEDSTLVDDDAGAYAVTKRDTDLALAEVDGITRVLLRPPSILGGGETSIWNTLRPERIRNDESQRHAVPEATWAWVHVDDLARLVAALATGEHRPGSDPEAGPVDGGCTALNVGAESATQRDYIGTVCESVGVEPVWEEGPAWTGRFAADRARRWGWEPHIDLSAALGELRDGLTG